MRTILLLALCASISLAFYTSSSDVVSLTDKNFNSDVTKSSDIWLVEFYAPWCGHCQSLKPEYEKVAKALKGIVKVGAVDADQYKSLGSQFGIQGFPTIKLFGADKKTPIDFASGRDADSIVNFVLGEVKKITKDRLTGKSKGSSEKASGKQQEKKQEKKSSGGSDVVDLTAANFDELVFGSKDIWMVEFFAPWCGHCKNLAPEWEEAATKLKGAVKYGKVDATVESALAQKYGVKGYPTIKYWGYGEKSSRNVQDYQGGRKAADLIQFSQNLLSKADIEPEVNQLLSQKQIKDECSEGSCVITFLPNILGSSASERNTYINTIKDAAKKQIGKPFKFLWTQSGDHSDVETKLNLQFGFPALVIINNQKQLHSVMRGTFNKDGINNFIEGILIGKGSLLPIPADLKFNTVSQWDGKDPVIFEEEEIDLSDVTLEDL